MLIDWFTVIAQLINFLVLVWLLKHFLYRPILDAIDAREKRIADELADADKKRLEAEQQREAFQQKNAEFDAHRTASMNQVADEAKVERTRLLNLVRQEADALRSKLALALENEQLSLQDSLSQSVRDEVFLIVRKALSDLANTSLEASMTAIFIQRLAKLKNEEKASLALAFKDTDQPLIVQTAFDLPGEQSELIRAALKEILDDAVDIQFVTETGLISGIEINANGQKIAWSIAEYLATLTKHVNQVMQSTDTNHDKVQVSDSEEQAL